ncbi:MAG: hypothetical protein AAF639_23775 [Chloroflexota bacterium]
MIITPAYTEIIDFISSSIPPQNLINFRPSEKARERIEELIYREKTDGLTDEETAELDHYLMLEHIMRMAKARARRFLQ